MSKSSNLTRREFVGAAVSAAAVSAVPVHSLFSSCLGTGASASTSDWKDEGVLFLDKSPYAKLHNIPAVYIIALNSTLSIGRSPLQDVSEHGMNIVPQLRAELGDACIVIDDLSKLADQMERAQSILAESKPVAIAFHPDILSKDIDIDVPRRERPRILDQIDADRFVNEFPAISRGRRVII